MKPIRLIFLSWLTIFAVNVHATDAANPLLLGVLEEPQCSEIKDIQARIMFAYDGTVWHTLTSSDLDVNKQITSQGWTVEFDGKSLGTLMLIDQSPNAPMPSDWYYGRDKLYSYAGKVKAIVNAKKAFGGWCDPPQMRPLVLVSMPNVSDPDHWKPFSMENDYKQKLYQAFKRSVGKVINCKDAYDNKSEPFLFGATDLKIYNVYRSSKGSALISIGLDLGKYHCDGPSDNSWAPQWFLMRNDQITIIGNGMELVDAGDYNGDGKSEILFWRNGYNEDGYILYFDNLRKRVEYKWSYH